MNGEHAQIITLVTHGNARLSAAPDAATPPLDSALMFVAELRFARYSTPDAAVKAALLAASIVIKCHESHNSLSCSAEFLCST